MKNIIIIYHKDEDGFGGAWAGWKKFGNKAEYLAGDPRDPLPWKEMPKNKEIYFIDFCLPLAEMEKILAAGNDVTVIDHHVTSKETSGKMPHRLWKLENSGAVLAWQYFHPKKKVPLLLKYIEDMDLYNWKLKKSQEIYAALFLREFDFKVYSNLVSDFEKPAKFKKYVEEGAAILRYKNKMVEKIAADAEETEIDGQKAFVVNSAELKSEIGNWIVEKKKAVGIIWSFEKGKLKVSLRSSKSGNLADVSALAKKFGGGGHKAASGFAFPIKIDFPWK